MSKKFKVVKDFYDNRMWNISMVRNAVVKGWITAEEFYDITGLEYNP